MDDVTTMHSSSLAVTDSAASEVFVVELAEYSGPLDLLLTLIRDEQIDIYDIPIARIAEQFLARISSLKLDEAADYLEMAARLVRIKAQMLLRCIALNIFTRTMQLQFVLTCQISDKLFVRIGFRSAQLVIEMNYGKHNSEFLPQVQQQTQKRDGIRTGRHRNPNSVACLQELVSPDVMEKTLCQCLHGFMVHPKLVRRWFSGPPRGRIRWQQLGCDVWPGSRYTR